MIDYAEMATLITTDPDGMGLSTANSDSANAAIFNSPNPQGMVVAAEMTRDLVINFLAGRGLLAVLQDDMRQTLSALEADAGVQNAATTLGSTPQVVARQLQSAALAVFDPSIEIFDPQDATVASLMDILVLTGRATSQDKTDFLALARRIATYAETKWGRGTAVSRRDIAVALGKEGVCLCGGG